MKRVIRVLPRFHGHFPRAVDLAHVKESQAFPLTLEWHRQNPPPLLAEGA